MYLTRETGNHSLAHDEFLEVINRDLAMDGKSSLSTRHMRQGHLIGVAKKSKRYTELFCGPGEAGEVKPYRSGTGCKGNHLEIEEKRRDDV